MSTSAGDVDVDDEPCHVPNLTKVFRDATSGYSCMKSLSGLNIQGLILQVVEKLCPEKLLTISAYYYYWHIIFWSKLPKWHWLTHIPTDPGLNSTYAHRTQKFIGNLFSTSWKIRTNCHPLISIAQAHADKNVPKFWYCPTETIMRVFKKGATTRGTISKFAHTFGSSRWPSDRCPGIPRWRRRGFRERLVPGWS